MDNLTPHLLSAFYTQHKRTYNRNHAFPKRRTTSYELVYFLDDSCCKMLLDNKEYQILGDTVVFRRPDQENQSFMSYESILLCFSFDELNDGTIVDHPLLHNIPTLNQNLNQASYRKIFEDIYKEFLLNRQYASYYLSSKLMEILYGLFLEQNTNMTNHLMEITNQNLLDLLNYVHANIEKSFTVQTMSHELSMSERYVYKLFKESLHVTPTQYINECKLNYAKKLLATSNIPVHQIGKMSGYDNSTYFITLFKRKYGTTPLQYRRQQK
ncbi:helix-turn-helix transcriptional regulator [Vallitalea okinawensis]|uniref:helix-turn-helix transcriptional regulator n=1 Tax=Vallitalea okinawensis TaxID=2078660 RepID=UPI000CFC3FA4|nr:AraC family transcriptional regulator [Vallitalea okinawensis]